MEKKKLKSFFRLKIILLDFLVFSFFFLSFYKQSNAQEDYKKGEKLFLSNCSACHTGGNNIIIPEKNLKRETLEANGMYNISAITYQVINGKNGMPAFGGRLEENEIQEIAIYILQGHYK